MMSIFLLLVENLYYGHIAHSHRAKIDIFIKYFSAESLKGMRHAST